MSRLLDVLLSTDPVQRARLAQAGMALLLLAAGVVAMQYFVWMAWPAPPRWGGGRRARWAAWSRFIC